MSLFASGERWRLEQGDSLTMLGGVPEQSVDLVFADPPYFLSRAKGTTVRSGRRVSVRKGQWDAPMGWEAEMRFTLRWMAACLRVLKPSGSLWVSGTHHVIFKAGFAAEQLGFHLLNTVVWYKPNAVPNLACRTATHSHELLLWLTPRPSKKLLHTYNYRRMKEQNGGTQLRDVWALPRTGEEELDAQGGGKVWTIPSVPKREKAHGEHPTQKPVALLERIIDASAPPQARILDPFNGSGTTGVVAVHRGHEYHGMDLSPEYLALTQRRLYAPYPAAPASNAA